MEPSPEARSTLEAAAHSIAILYRNWHDVKGAARGSRKADEDGAAASKEGQVRRDGGVGGDVRDALLRVLARMVELQCAHITNPKHRRVDAKNYRPNRYTISALHPAPQVARLGAGPLPQKVRILLGDSLQA